MIKKIATFSASAVLASGLFFGCKKPTPNVAPEPDTEVETAIDAAWATYVITDIDMICGFLGENELYKHFYVDIPGTASASSGTVDPTRDPDSKTLNIAFFKTKCMDGRLREGTIFLDYKYDPLHNPGANPNSEYYHEYGFAGKISLEDYKVDGWKIDEFDPKFPGYIYNRRGNNNDPAYYWEISGKYLLSHPTDPKKNIVWEGKIMKKITNPTQEFKVDNKIVKVVDKTKAPVITWSLATVSYSGTISGSTHGGIPFKMEVSDKTPLVRDFTCYPDKVAGVSLTTPPSATLLLRPEEHHPFVSGVASFTTSDKYPRQIYFGNEGSPDLASACDNNGEILIKGISYRVNFRK
jgi:hypothetical protein